MQPSQNAVMNPLSLASNGMDAPLFSVISSQNGGDKANSNEQEEHMGMMKDIEIPKADQMTDDEVGILRNPCHENGDAEFNLNEEPGSDYENESLDDLIVMSPPQQSQPLSDTAGSCSEETPSLPSSRSPSPQSAASKVGNFEEKKKKVLAELNSAKFQRRLSTVRSCKSPAESMIKMMTCLLFAVEEAESLLNGNSGETRVQQFLVRSKKKFVMPYDHDALDKLWIYITAKCNPERFIDRMQAATIAFCQEDGSAARAAVSRSIQFFKDSHVLSDNNTPHSLPPQKSAQAAIDWLFLIMEGRDMTRAKMEAVSTSDAHVHPSPTTQVVVG
ncbi:hypothetical protein CYMTET_56501 [Cymbomonas tetramitiformis]|uniref:Uncharacterized protein n=1 Tax=Cymbomonas tetramitiformis TaxID=36881 RepID=A0AAE0ELR9_9CHLO|nr:hypothetical protein CYMTET_56501 [Cymbomonas tetramitiformis]